MYTLYGSGQQERDLAGVAFRPDASGGNVAKQLTYNPTTRQITFDLGVQNLGTQTESYSIGIYLSTNDWISVNDERIHSYTHTLSSTRQGNYVLTITVPSWVDPGSYYFGWILDYKEEIPETDEDNNAQDIFCNSPSASWCDSSGRLVIN